MITVDQGDWDMHTDMGTVGRRLDVRQRRETSRGHRGVLQRPGHPADKVTLVTISEFGRRVVENDSIGTDHGYGNVMFVAGAGVRRRLPRHAGRGWPTATRPTCTVTTDYRQVLADIVSRRFGGSIPKVFPGLHWVSTGVMV